VGIGSVWGFAVVGVEAVPIRVEAHARNGLPGLTIVGLPGAAVREARERIRSGAACSGLALPSKRITINLSPGDVPKDGPGFDLPMALATLAACGHVPSEAVRGVGAVGEVSLEGLVRPTRGMLSIAEAVGSAGVRLLVTPIGALAAAREVCTIPVAGVRSLGEAARVCWDKAYLARIQERGERWVRGQAGRDGGRDESVDLDQVFGQHHAKRALEIAAAGGHHLLMVGTPGAGKTMLARRIGTILPALSRQEAIDVTRVWSAAGLHDARWGLLDTRPFRAPHHTASRAALIGGGGALRPGEVSLAHRGVLFLDELPEFSRDTLEALRQPLEEGRVSISRRAGTSVFPAQFTLVGAMNPCLCGYLGHREKTCRCTAIAIERYRARVSGPLIDRIDVLVEVAPLTLRALEGGTTSESSSVVRERVAASRRFAKARLGSECGGSGAPLEDRACLTDGARALLRGALVGDGLGGRGYVRTIGVARTIADLDADPYVRPDHVAEALAMRLDHRRVRFG